MTETEQPLSVRQAAEFLNVTPGYVYNLVHFRKLTAYKPGGKKLLFKQADLEKYAFRNQISASGDLSDKADKIIRGKK